MPRTQSAEAAPRRQLGYGEGTITEQKKLPDGRLLIRWKVYATPPGGEGIRRRGTTRGTISDAKRDMRAARAEIEKGIASVDPSMTVKALLDDWLKVKAAHVKPRTLMSYRDTARLYVAPRLGNVKVKALSAGVIQRYHADLAAETELERARKLTHVVLSQALDHAVILGVIAHNPALSVKVPKIAAPRRLQMEEEGEVMALYPDEARALYRAAMKDATPHAWAIAFALHTGMRRAEVFGLKWQAADLAERPDAPHGLVHIRETLVCGMPQAGKSRLGNEKRGRATSQPKTRRSRRTLRLNSSARAVLDAVFAWQGEQAARGNWQPSGYVFTTATGAPQHPNNVKRKAQQLQAQIGRGDRAQQLPFHGLTRHTFVSLAYAAGVPIDDISRACGHEGRQTTEGIYRHIFDKAAPLVSLGLGSGIESNWQERKAELDRQRWETVSLPYGEG